MFDILQLVFATMFYTAAFLAFAKYMGLWPLAEPVKREYVEVRRILLPAEKEDEKDEVSESDQKLLSDTASEIIKQFKFKGAEQLAKQSDDTAIIVRVSPVQDKEGRVSFVVTASEDEVKRMASGKLPLRLVYVSSL